MSAHTFVITRPDVRKTVEEFLHRQLGLAWAAARDLVKEGNVTLDDRPCRNSRERLQRGQRLKVDLPKDAVKPTKKKPPPPRRPARPAKPTGPVPVIVYADEQVVVVEKPPGLTTMRHAFEEAEFGPRKKRFLPDTLEDALPDLLAKREGTRGTVRAVHRLDKETSGLVVFARTPDASQHLGRQFRAHTVGRRYLALVRGRAKDARIESSLVRDRGDGRRGSGKPGGGQKAVTHVRVLEQFGDAALVECRLETGRTHQVRIHLGEAGTPLCGETVYDRPLNGAPLPDPSGAKRVALHATTLGFIHPATGKAVEWTSDLPEDLLQVLQRLRSRR
jgi:23S rRNA pseudouridine1911/1915/1917 synthase